MTYGEMEARAANAELAERERIDGEEALRLAGQWLTEWLAEPEQLSEFLARKIVTIRKPETKADCCICGKHGLQKVRDRQGVSWCVSCLREQLEAFAPKPPEPKSPEPTAADARQAFDRLDITGLPDSIVAPLKAAIEHWEAAEAAEKGGEG